jgi:hypothetical protein
MRPSRILHWLAIALVAAFILLGVLAPVLGLDGDTARPPGLDEPHRMGR